MLQNSIAWLWEVARIKTNMRNKLSDTILWLKEKWKMTNFDRFDHFWPLLTTLTLKSRQIVKNIKIPNFSMFINSSPTEFFWKRLKSGKPNGVLTTLAGSRCQDFTLTRPWPRSRSRARAKVKAKGQRSNSTATLGSQRVENGRIILPQMPWNSLAEVGRQPNLRPLDG